ncbi:alpha/beta-hydrolase [Hypoxylon fragiforme]|uniref:alpha/beta-hydrolase n=1 Tax=Hypoxylon fragiforme TaxID=63214 RepID=UPI0020C679D1|nr:alpha/beta-hydrolase [Hypoxylon fragiforme]KAI2604023.1 alpha/beta-hydrolase [Hypoxylon fragiforme]
MEGHVNRLLSTTEVPPRFLNSALLVGHIPHKALASDSRVSYSLYVPPRHYGFDAGLVSAPAKLPLLISVHGTRRYFNDIKDLVPFAESTPCAILTPLFPTGLDSPMDIDSYKVLKSRTLRSDLALLSMLDEVAYRWPGIDTDKVFLMGFSGGGQFVHRFLYLYPERLAAASVGAPGRVTHLDGEKNWPNGIKDVETVLGKAVDTELIKQVPIQLVIGGEDYKIPGGDEFWQWVRELKAQRTGKVADGTAPDGLQPLVDQGRTDTLRELRDSWKALGIEAQLDVVPGVEHDSGGVRECVLAFLLPLIQKRLKGSTS